MDDVIAPKRLSLKPRFVESMMFLKLNMSLIPNNLADVTESLIWNILIPSHVELPDNMDNPDENENEKDDDDDDDEEDDLSPMPVESEETDYTCWV